MPPGPLPDRPTCRQRTRDPSYEVWGVTIRGRSLVLVILLVAAFARGRGVDPRDAADEV